MSDTVAPPQAKKLKATTTHCIGDARREESKDTSRKQACWEWLKRRGASLSKIELCYDKNRGSYIRCLEDIPSDEPALLVPFRRVLTMEKAWGSEFGKKRKKCGEECSNELMFWMFMARGRNAAAAAVVNNDDDDDDDADDDDFGPYLLSLPKTADIPTACPMRYLNPS